MEQKKLLLLMTGKSQNPCCFKNIKTKLIEYKANKIVWMTGELFEGWFLKHNRKLCKQNRKILLLIDHCTAHNSIPLMKNMKAIFFTPNVISDVHPKT